MMLQFPDGFEIGEIVYLKTDIYQRPRVVTGILLRPNDQLVYKLGCGADETEHFECEMSECIDRAMKIDA